MRRTRQGGPKVWHNPELDTFARRRGTDGAGADAGADERRHQQAAGGDALVAVKDAARNGAPARARGADGKQPARIVLAAPADPDPVARDKQRLVSRLLLAEGRPAVTKAARELVTAGHGFPIDQDVQLKLLEHADEEQVVAAIAQLEALLAAEAPKRRSVLESRLRNLEEYAEEATTRTAAERLRRRLGGRARRG
jgi:hypothetical protein